MSFLSESKEAKPAYAAYSTTIRLQHAPVDLGAVGIPAAVSPVLLFTRQSDFVQISCEWYKKDYLKCQPLIDLHCSSGYNGANG
ncbi:hypothetical protein [Paenibacillus sonchi]|nr:hypothetical protein [Paenibacillus sonchi]